MTPEKLSGKFFIIRDCINWAKDMGIDNMLIVPCHWYGDAQDTQVIMRMNSGLKLVPKADMARASSTSPTASADNGTEVDCSGSMLRKSRSPRPTTTCPMTGPRSITPCCAAA